MQVIKTWIVADETGIQTVFQTYEGLFFITTHSGALIKINEDEAKDLIRKTNQFLK